MRRILSSALLWFVPAMTTFEHLHARVGRPVAFANGALVPDAVRLMLVRPDGSIAWRHEVDDGVWGHPVVLDDDRAAVADLVRSLHFVDSRGRSAGTVELPAAANTELLVGEDGELFLGVGTLRCDVLCVDAGRRIQWQVTVGRDDGLTFPLACHSSGGLWVPTNDGLLLLDRRTGRQISRIGNDGEWRCVSGVLPMGTGALVAVAGRADQCHLVRVSADGHIQGQSRLPSLQRARLVASTEGRTWLIGSTASGADPLEHSDRVLVVEIGTDGEPGRMVELPGDRSVDGAPAEGGGIWVATYTGDEPEHGVLYLLDCDGDVVLQWSPDVDSGVGAPLILSKDRIDVPTSRGLACLQLSSR